MELKHVATEASFKSQSFNSSAKEGDLAICESNQKIYQYSNKEWKEFKPKGGGLNMSLYDLNKTVIDQFPALTQEQLNKYRIEINQFVRDVNNDYFMLLCNEIHYYTVFAASTIFENNQKLGDILIDLFSEDERIIVAIEKEAYHYEIWAKSATETNVFLLFPYDKGVIKYGR